MSWILSDEAEPFREAIKTAVEAEREACAKIADGEVVDDPHGGVFNAGRDTASRRIATHIRARSTPAE